ncbi:integrase arm-type DNA-binding domain-containing protein [Ochrobactrum sp. MR28]|nr:integrase arm-type DNA-binding domain-containing protein [Ochrobactrum sp. MR28]MBX8817984.1 integrase arm-type DNA-binding domain-containing protein [Ochrobactrum sp. MR31]
MLTDVAIRKAKPADKSYHLTDANGLSVFITTAGGKLWRYRYRYDGKAAILSLGAYPDVSLLEAREMREEARKQLKSGLNPSLERKKALRRKIAATNNTFEVITREWYELQKPMWVERHAADVIGSLERDVFPYLGTETLKDITPPDVLDVLRKIERRPAIETAHRVRQRMSAVFVYAIACGRAENDPAAIVQKALAPIKKGRRPAVLTIEEAREVMAAVENTPAHPVTKLAMRLLMLTVVRPGTLTTTPWSEFANLEPENPIWRIPAARMKMSLSRKDDTRNDHYVPLSNQAVETIKELAALTGKGPLVFPNVRHAHKPMSENALGYLLNRAGYYQRHVPHGWRSTFSTIMNERFPADRHVIDAMLAHTPKDKVESAYNRAKHLERRSELYNRWSQMLFI